MVVGGCSLIGLGMPSQLDAGVSVEPAGMKVVWKTLKKEFDGFQTYNSTEGVYLSLGVSSGDKGIIGFDKKKSKIKLMAGKQDLEGGFEMWNTRTNKAGTMMRVEVASKKLPAADVTDLKVSGAISLILSSKKETKSTKVTAYKKGNKVELVKGFSFVVDSLGKPKWGDHPLEISLKWNREIPELAAVRFFDADGKEIESSPNGSSSMDFMGKKSVSKQYKFKRKVDQFRIEMDLWVDMEQVSAPVDFTLGMGGRKK